MKTTLHSAGPASLTSGRLATSIHTLSEVAHHTISALRCTASGRGTEKGGLNSGLWSRQINWCRFLNPNRRNMTPATVHPSFAEIANGQPPKDGSVVMVCTLLTWVLLEKHPAGFGIKRRISRQIYWFCVFDVLSADRNVADRACSQQRTRRRDNGKTTENPPKYGSVPLRCTSTCRDTAFFGAEPYRKEGSLWKDWKRWWL